MKRIAETPLDKNLTLVATGKYIEFKESVDKTLAEEVCAFANASGGRLFIRISDSGNITGTDTSNVARSRIQDTIRQIQPEQ